MTALSNADLLQFRLNLGAQLKQYLYFFQPLAFPQSKCNEIPKLVDELIEGGKGRLEIIYRGGRGRSVDFCCVTVNLPDVPLRLCGILATPPPLIGNQFSIPFLFSLYEQFS